MTVAAAVLTLALAAPADAIEPQQASNWCWASSIQDVLSQAGIHQSQSQVAARLTGWPQDRPASPTELVYVLRSYGMRAAQAGRPGTPYELAASLQSGSKLIAFVRPTNGPVGHFIVLEGMTDQGAIIVSDPANGMTWAQPPAMLYYAWRWSDTVVVRPPIAPSPFY